MNPTSPAPHTLWVEIDWEIPAPAVDIIGEFVRAVRPSDPVELAVPSRALSEANALALLVSLLNDLPGFAARGTRLPEIAVHAGSIPEYGDVLGTATPGAVATSRQRLHDLRRELATLAAVTPVMDRADWAQRWLPEPGFYHLVADNASSDGTAEILRAAGADVVVGKAPIGRVANWSAAMNHFRTRTSLTWLKWLFAGDELLPGAADILDEATAAYPEARLIVAEHMIRQLDGQTHHWRELETTRLVMPDEALERSAAHGNWFDSPAGHAFHRDVLDEVDFGSHPYVADWQACLSIARRHPVLYIAEPVSVFDVSSRLFFQARQQEVYSLVQELSLRHQSLDSLRGRVDGNRDLSQLERQLDEYSVHSLTERVQQRAGRVAVIRDRSRGQPGADGHNGGGPAIAVQAPRGIDASGLDFMGYAPEFAARYARYAYLPELDRHPEVLARRVRGEPVIDANHQLEVVTSAEELNRVADILLCFEGRAYLPEMAPPRQFTGLKAYHVWEFVFYAPESNAALVDGRVDLALGYCRHDEYSPFFRALYPSFTGRTLAVPFGFAPRFQPTVPFEDRFHKVVGLGSVNPVDDPLCPPGVLDAYVAYHPGERWTHRWRRTLLERADELTDVLDARFPVFPQEKDTSYDAVEMLNGYAMFANDPGLMAFPPARTYEGAACGTLMIGEDSAVHRDLGFVHGVNALLHPAHDVDAFARVAREALAEPERLAAMADAGRRLVQERYTHAAVARTLYGQLCRAFAGREP